jgi:hypothetical protein
MTSTSIRFHCPGCQARIKAPLQLVGQERSCPGCGDLLLVPPVTPEDSGPVLVLLEQGERLTLGIRHGMGAIPTRSKALYRSPQSA